MLYIATTVSDRMPEVLQIATQVLERIPEVLYIAATASSFSEGADHSLHSVETPAEFLVDVSLRGAISS